MTRNYCAVSDARFLPQLLALYESLKRHSSEPFTLFVLPLDDECARQLASMVLPGIQMVLGFEDAQPGMKEAKANRSYAEYCYTCASNFSELLINTGLEEVTYLDSDIWFAGPTSAIFDEIRGADVAITPHRFAFKDRHRIAANGAFNVGIVHFKNTEWGRECLSKWAAQVRERCSLAIGCADQKYLDSWESDYGPHCCVIENIGVNAGPWNIGQYRVTAGPCLNGYPLIAYHFHETRFNEDGTVKLTNWPLRPEEVRLIYGPYVVAVLAAKTRIAELAAV